MARARADRGRAGPVRPAHALRRAAARATGCTVAEPRCEGAGRGSLAARARARAAVLLRRRLVRRRGSRRGARGARVRRLHGARPFARRTSPPTRRGSPLERRSGSGCRAAGACSSFPRRTRSAWPLARLVGGLGSYVHVYFHDTDLLARSRRMALQLALGVLARRANVTDLESLSRASHAAPRPAVRPGGRRNRGTWSVR